MQSLRKKIKREPIEVNITYLIKFETSINYIISFTGKY